MKLSLEGIKSPSDWEAAGIALPGYNIEAAARKAQEAPRWAHFGIGNIFRIFIGSIADGLLEKGELDTALTCVETFDYDVVDKIYRPFDNLGLSVILNPDGTRLDTGKRFRAMGAAIYGLSEYVVATGDESVLSYARNLFETTEKEGFDQESGLYRDMKSRDWGQAEPQLKDETFCTHLNILEGYTNLYKVWKDERLRSRIIALLTIMADKVLAGPCDEEGHGCRNIVEASWQMLKAAFAVRDIYVINKVRPVVKDLLAKAADGDSGSKLCEKTEKVVADLWAWKYLNDGGAADRALACWNTIKGTSLEGKCGNGIFRLGRLCVEVSDMFM